MPETVDHWCSLSDVARYIGKSKQVVRRLHERYGCPHEKRDGDHSNAKIMVNLPLWLARWKADQEEDEPDADLQAASSPSLERYRMVKADLAEIELAQKRGELVPLDHFQQITATALGHVSRAVETMCDACRDRYDQAVTAAGDELARVFSDDRSGAEQYD